MTDVKPPAPAAKPGPAPVSSPTKVTPPAPPPGSSVTQTTGTAPAKAAPPLPKATPLVRPVAAPPPPASAAPVVVKSPAPVVTKPTGAAGTPIAAPTAPAVKPTVATPTPPKPNPTPVLPPKLPPKAPLSPVMPRPPLPASPPKTATPAPVPTKPGGAVPQPTPDGESTPPASRILPAPRPAAPATSLPSSSSKPALTPPASSQPRAPLSPGQKPPISGSGAPPPAAPQPAQVKKSPLRFLPLVALLLLVVGVIAFLFNRFGSSRTPVPVTDGGQPAVRQTTITYWGLWEPSTVLAETLADFEAQNPEIRVEYQQQTFRDYRERLQTAIAGGRGPDVFRFHASWVPMLRAELDPMPDTVYGPAEYQTTFYPIVAQQLELNGRYVGVPLMYEGLALLYNRQILDVANARPPQTWSELADLANTLTLRNGRQVQRAGLAIGNAGNVDNFSDILGLLILQNGGDPSRPSDPKTLEAITFYTDFFTKNQVWSAQLPSSTIAFARGEVAMIFAPSWRIHEIVNQNPNLQIGVAPVPQLGDTKITWGSYWAEGVSAQSLHKEAAWRLIKYLSSVEGLEKMHADASRQRPFGELYPRVEMANVLAENQFAAAYLADAPYAQSWYLNSRTHDNGLNDQIIKYYEDLINALTQGGADVDKILPAAQQGIQQVLRQYNLTR